MDADRQRAGKGQDSADDCSLDGHDHRRMIDISRSTGSALTADDGEQ
jgi:hypothetical protein